MSAGWNVYAVPVADPKAREWVTRAKDANEAGDFTRYLEPKLPPDMRVQSTWDTRTTEPDFDLARLQEKPREWKPEEEGEGSDG
jgi:hypothetical protein